MAEIELSDCTINTKQGGDGLVEVTITTPNTADNGDYLTIPLKDYGIKTFKKCVGTYQSTEDSVAVEVAFTTSVTTGTLTVTLDSTAGSNKKRIAKIWGSS